MSSDLHDTQSDDISMAATDLELAVELAAEIFLKMENDYLREYEELLDGLDKGAKGRPSTRVSEFALQSARQQLHEIRQLHQQIVKSRSWRYTKPFRAIARLASGDLESFSEGLWNQIKHRVEALPREQRSFNQNLMFSCTQVFSFLLTGSPNYRRWREGYLTSPVSSSKDSVLESHQFSETIAGLHLQCLEDPLVSVIIPSYGNLKYTLSSIQSVARFPSSDSQEVIVAEDASADPDMARLKEIDGLVYLENESNLGFLRSCNRAVQSAKGKYLLFLNSDAQVTSRAIDSLLGVFKSFPDAGVVGSMLVYPDGRLQEAGGVVWRDGSALNVGRLQNPGDYAFNYLRETDYCSAAAIVIERQLFLAIGGFDELYSPAYYEDTDLAFKVRRAGRKVLFQPLSVVIHHEGLSHGTDLSGGVKSNQLVNQAKFRDRWADVLDEENLGSGKDFFLAKDRSQFKKTVLVFHDRVPEPDKDAGSRSISQFMQTMLSMGLNVKFWPVHGSHDLIYARQLQQLGIEVLHDRFASLDLADWFAAHSKYIDYVLVSRPTIWSAVVPIVRTDERVKVLFYGHDIYHERLQTQLELMPDDDALRREQKFYSQMERQLWLEADAIYYPTAREAETVSAFFLRAEHSDVPVRVVPVYAYSQFPVVSRDPKVRDGLVMVAGFRHAPNVDGAIWFKRHILPKILEILPQTKLFIVGSNPPPSISALEDSNTTITGFVSDEELEQIYGRSRVAIAPLRFGAGMKGKIVESLYFGVPVVSSPIGAQGFEGYPNAVSIADSEEEFASMTLRLLQDDIHWTEACVAGQALVRSRFSSAALASLLRLDIDA